jgi:beta-glucosidase
VVGPNAALLQSLEGNYNGTPVTPVLPVDGLRAVFGANRVRYAPGAPLADGFRMPVPESALRPDADSDRQGLKGEYFDNPDFSGTPRLTRVDPVVNLNFEHSAPAGFTPGKFSVRWTGTISAPQPGRYEIGFRLAARKGQPVPEVKVWIDDTLVFTPQRAGIDAANTAVCVAGNCDQKSSKVEFDFADDKPHRVRIDFPRTLNDRASIFEWTPPRDALLPDAVAAAKASDVTVALVGLSPNLEGEEMKVDVPGFRGGDRTTLDLPEAQRRMLQALKASGKPLVVVYLTGGPISDPWVEANADAILQAWYPGEAGGTAIARVLAGQVNPAGRLPYTIVRSEADLPPFDDYSMKGRTYRYFKGPVLHAFGEGLSYTRFAYDRLALSATRIQAGQPVRATVRVRNTGPRDGDEVVQLYVAKPGSSSQPVLGGFRRVHLKRGESRSVAIDLDARLLSQVDAGGARSVAPGVYTLHAGGGQPGRVKAAAALLRIDGTTLLPK